MIRTFCILDAAEVADEDFKWDTVLESLHSLRWSVDGTKTLVKWEGETPEAFEDKTIYTYAEIKAVMLTPAWRAESEI